MRLQHKLALANLLFKIVFMGLFLAVTPWLSERINLYQTDNDLIEKREEVIGLISDFGVAPFLVDETEDYFASYNILKEEFISLEQIDLDEYWNFIEVTQRRIDDEVIDYRVLNYSFLVDGETYLLEIGQSLSSIAVTERNIRRVTIAFLFLFLLVSVLFELAYTGALLKPLNRIVAKIRATTIPENYDLTPVVSSTQDFKMLDSTLSELMKKISAALQNEREITQNISHELLTPISLLRNKLENILMREQIDEELAIKVNESLATLHRLKTLVNSLLLIARIESNQYLRNDNVQIGDLINEVVEELHPMADDGGVVLIQDYTRELHLFQANRPLLFSLFFNVINNALKHTPRGGEIWIHGYRKKKRCVVEVLDSGEGIPADLLPDIFMRFKKRNGAEDDGSGIGLAIAKSVADFHQIRVEVSSEPGKGTRFVFSWEL
ncbi:sensor histidine kinase [Geofilum rubicundum]|uniref:histidine kinase n=1 Tax=Geofilum rubicundum JCM 15548 TaxID=1236989 RepID=A0A0E9LWY0_9BACT|nr:HAMP domain-containing sensor histidine kinase [Geofilum rubicundum]GAO29631.1 sensor histidine kinase ResE [Geofilum rubicundum JCM 15548]